MLTAPAGHTHRAVAAAVIAVVAGALAAVLTACGWPAAAYRDSDFFQFWAGARAVVSGASPYDLAWWTHLHLEHGSRAIFMPPQPPAGPAWTTPYPLPLFVLLAPIGMLPFNAAASVWLTAQLVLAAAALTLMLRTVRGASTRRTALLLGCVVIASQPLWLLIIGGNTAGALLVILTAALTTAARGQHLRSGALMSLLLLKPHPFMITGLTALLGAARDRTALVRMLTGGAVVSGALVLCAFAVDPGWPARWWRMAGALQGSDGSNATLWTISRVLPGGTALTLLCAVLLVGGFVLWARRREPGTADLLAASVPLSLILAPHGWSYDHLYLLIPVARLLADGRTAVRTVTLTVFVVGGWLLYLTAHTRGGEELSVLLPLGILGLSCVFLGTGRADRRAPDGTTAPGA